MRLPTGDVFGDALLARGHGKNTIMLTGPSFDLLDKVAVCWFNRGAGMTQAQIFDPGS